VSELTLHVDPRRDHIQGPSTAPLQLVEYGDFECPYCGHAYYELEEVRERMRGRLCFVFRHFPLSRIHPHAMAAAEAAEAAGEQDKFWQMHNMLFENQESLEHWDLLHHARVLHVDTQRFEDAMASHRNVSRIREHFRSGVVSGVNGTPTLFINGQRHDGGWDAPSVIAALERVLHGGRESRVW